MPRATPDRTIGGDRTVAQRVAEERQAREWTLEGLSRRMEAAGCPIHVSALHKLEKGRPPRRVTVDELVAFSLVFEIPVGDLVTPAPLLRDRKLRRLVNRWWDAREAMAAARQYLLDAEVTLRAHLVKNPKTTAELEQALAVKATETVDVEGDPEQAQSVAVELSMLLSRPWTSLSAYERQALERFGIENP